MKQWGGLLQTPLNIRTLLWRLKMDVDALTNDDIKNVIAFSGGKDSVALLLHAIERVWDKSIQARTDRGGDPEHSGQDDPQWEPDGRPPEITRTGASTDDEILQYGAEAAAYI